MRALTYRIGDEDRLRNTRMDRKTDSIITVPAPEAETGSRKDTRRTSKETRTRELNRLTCAVWFL
ncbi:hypothetical protein DPMN_098575 [Dreissena polymorpha]|uniref:Uncharacterized protein n=1 Tax=Dreissena polymorpha TaxID=45954 RepID=A0A9D4LCF8_DREPO|nr:hypothetical protein DPMN_098575 [Dreissena polymorpha]